jgi:hypothetical protein
MTTTEETQPNAEPSTGKVSALAHAVNGVLVRDAPTAEFDSAALAADRRPLGDRPRHRRPPRWQTISDREISLDRRVRLRLLAGSLVGTGCLVLAYRLLQPGEASPVAAPSGAVAWAAVLAGIVGVWLVPGLWLSAVMMRAGIGPTAQLSTRIGTTLAWYALVGPVIHVSADGAFVTRGGIVGATVAATAATCLGIALGLVRRPANPLLRVLVAALAGGICAQTAIWLSMRIFTDGVNYEQIQRLDWWIVLACALLTAVGAGSRPDLPMLRTTGQIRMVLLALAVVAVTAVALLAVGSRWSPVQRMPSAIGAEQVPAPPGVDVAFALTAIGPEGQGQIQRATFTASDDTGRPVAVSTRLLLGGTADPVTLLVVLDPVSRSQLCGRTAAKLGKSVAVVDGPEQDWPVKLTLRDQAVGMHVVQAVLPVGWCDQ